MQLMFKYYIFRRWVRAYVSPGSFTYLIYMFEPRLCLIKTSTLGRLCVSWWAWRDQWMGKHGRTWELYGYLELYGYFRWKLHCNEMACWLSPLHMCAFQLPYLDTVNEFSKYGFFPSISGAQWNVFVILLIHDMVCFQAGDNIYRASGGRWKRHGRCSTSLLEDTELASSLGCPGCPLSTRVGGPEESWSSHNCEVV